MALSGSRAVLSLSWVAAAASPRDRPPGSTRQEDARGAPHLRPADDDPAKDAGPRARLVGRGAGRPSRGREPHRESGRVARPLSAKASRSGGAKALRLADAPGRESVPLPRLGTTFGGWRACSPRNATRSTTWPGPHAPEVGPTMPEPRQRVKEAYAGRPATAYGLRATTWNRCQCFAVPTAVVPSSSTSSSRSASNPSRSDSTSARV